MPEKDLVLFYPEGHEAHFALGHPERPERVETMRLALQSAGWWQGFPHLEPSPPSIGLLQSVHTSQYLKTLETACRQGEWLDQDTYTTPASWDLALKSAGGAIAIASAVWKGGSGRAALHPTGLALTRPPGHHATPGWGMGFCLLNNVALAAENLIQDQGARRLAIVDLDIHHGNGTQDIFWRRQDVFYLSTHQFPLFPGSGRVDEVGGGPGAGYTANFPLPPGSGDQAFYAVMSELILPILERFAPEMLLVSIGFDAHWRDPLGSLQLSASAFRDLLAELVAFADRHCSGKLALFLEGGYDLQAAAACALASVSALLNRPWQDPLGPAPYVEDTSWRIMLQRAKEIWKV
jgi:acetoin utilization deacetylase AcuC-like enzyme